MKKAFVSPLCSALVIPGLGQLLNQQLKKGVAFLGAVFVLFVAAVIAMYGTMKSALSGSLPANPGPESIIRNLGSQDFTALRIIFGIFAIIWILSVLDAFLAGRKLDRLPSQGR